MRVKSIGLLSMAITCAAAISISISSCNSNSPTTPADNGGVDHSKSPAVLGDNCKSTVAVTDCPNGNATLSYNDDGDLVVRGLDGGAANSVSCNFANPINVWRGSIEATFPDAGGSLTYAAKDDRGNTEAQVDLVQEGTGYKVYPTFTSAANAGELQYDAIVYNNGSETGRFEGIAARDFVRINTVDCILKVTSIGWDVYQVNAQCAFKFGLDPCCNYQFQLPNGQIINGNQIKLVERNTNGVYVYLNTHSITTSGNVSSYAIHTASGYSS